MADANPAGPAGGIPDGLKGAFDSALNDLGLDSDEALQGSFQDEPGDDRPPPPVEEPDSDADADGEDVPHREPRAPSPRPSLERKPTAQQRPGQPGQPAAAAVEAPAGFDEQRTAQFQKLPPDAQAFVKELATDYQEHAQTLGSYARYAQQVRSLITDEHRQAMVRGGFKNEVEAIAHLINLNDWATTEFPQYARWAVGQYSNGDLVAGVRALFPEAFTGDDDGTDADGNLRLGQQSARAEPDPIQRQVFDALGNVVRRLDGIESTGRQARLRQADQVIARFRTEKDASGRSKYPFLKDVEKVVARIVKQPEYLAIEDMGERLAAAYDAAVAWVPQVREKWKASERAKWEADQRQRNDVTRARKAKATIHAPSNGAAPQRTQGLDAAIDAAMRGLGI
jgi:hypothetical protein